MTVKATQTRFATNAALRDILQRIISRAHSGNEDDYYSETFGPDFETAAALLSQTEEITQDTLAREESHANPNHKA